MNVSLFGRCSPGHTWVLGQTHISVLVECLPVLSSGNMFAPVMCSLLLNFVVDGNESKFLDNIRQSHVATLYSLEGTYVFDIHRGCLYNE